MVQHSKPREQRELDGPRRCLMCGQLFASDGPHNRICRRCKGKQAWREGEIFIADLGR